MSSPVALGLIECFGVLISVLCFIHRTEKELLRQSALLICSIILVAVICFWYYFDKCGHEYQILCQIEIIPDYNLNVALGLDGNSLLFLGLTTLVFPICIFGASTHEINTKKYLILLLMIELFLILSFLITNLFFFYVFFESVLIPMFIIIGIWGSRERRIKAAYYFFLYTVFGSFFLLFGILYIYTIAETTEYAILQNLCLTKEEQIFMWIFFFLPFAIKVPMFPFHIWLPEAHVEAPTIGSVLLASLLLKLGGYGFLRFTIPLFFLGCDYFSYLVYLMAIFSVIYASLSTIIQKDLKRLIAYSSVAHMNLIVLGIFSLTYQGLDGGIYLMIGHGIVSSGLFLCVGVIYERLHTRMLLNFSGLLILMPLFVLSFFIFTLANMSFPGTSNFVGEFLIFTGLFEKNPFVMVLAGLGIIFSSIYSIWVYNRMSLGVLKTPAVMENYMDLNQIEAYILGLLIILMVVLGVDSSWVTNLTSLFINNLLALIQNKF